MLHIILFQCNRSIHKSSKTTEFFKISFLYMCVLKTKNKKINKMFTYRVQSVLSCGTYLTSITPHRLSLPYIWHRYTEDSILCPSLQRPWMITCLYLGSQFPISTVTIAINTKSTSTTRADGTNVDNHVIWRKGRKWDTGKKTKRVADAPGQRFPGRQGQ